SIEARMSSAVTRPRHDPTGTSSGGATAVTWASIRAWPSLTEIMAALYVRARIGATDRVLAYAAPMAGTCPRCGFAAVEERTCPRCGVDVERYRAEMASAVPAPAAAPRPV